MFAREAGEKPFQPLFDVRSWINPSWPKLEGSPPEIRFSFAFTQSWCADSPSLSAQPAYVDKTSSLSPLGAFNQRLATRAMQLWASAVNVRFIQADDNPQLQFFGFTPVSKSNVPGGYANPAHWFGCKHQTGVGLNTDVLTYHESSTRLYTMIHEVGHILGAGHPFESPIKLTGVGQQLNIFSVMNYDYAYVEFAGGSGTTWIRVITPMPADIAAMQAMHGVNRASNTGDNVYDLGKYINNWLEHPERKGPTIASFPWDNSGNDTITAHGVVDNVQVNLRPYSRSRIGDTYFAMPDMDIENVVGGLKRNKIVLNHCDNRVDVSEGRGAKITVDPRFCGHDTITGFGGISHGDELIIQKSPVEAPPHYTIRESAAGLKIIFDENNSVLLAGVAAKDIMPSDIRVQEDPTVESDRNILRQREFKQTEAAILDSFSTLPRALFHDFQHAFIRGMLFTFIDSLTEASLRKYQCTPQQIQCVMQLTQALIALYTGSFVSSVASVLTSSLFRHFGVSQAYCALAGTMASTLVNAVQDNASIKLPKLIATTAGCYLGSQFTLWATRGYVDNQQADAEEDELDRLEKGLLRK